MIQPLELKSIQLPDSTSEPSPKGAPLQHISASTVKLYLTCPLRFWFKKVLLLPEPASATLHLGKAVMPDCSVFIKHVGGDYPTTGRRCNTPLARRITRQMKLQRIPIPRQRLRTTTRERCWLMLT